MNARLPNLIRNVFQGMRYRQFGQRNSNGHNER